MPRRKKCQDPDCTEEQMCQSCRIWTDYLKIPAYARTDPLGHIESTPLRILMRLGILAACVLVFWMVMQFMAMPRGG